METPNAIKICQEIGGFMYCENCPIYSVCEASYPNTEEFEKAIESAAIEYLRGKKT